MASNQTHQSQRHLAFLKLRHSLPFKVLPPKYYSPTSTTRPHLYMPAIQKNQPQESSRSKSWDIRSEALTFELNFRELLDQEQELYSLTVDDDPSDTFTESNGSSLCVISENGSNLTSQSLQNATLNLDHESVRRQITTSTTKPLSINSPKKPNAAYMELLFSYKSKSMELYTKQIAWLTQRVTTIDPNSIILPGPPSELEELNQEIDQLSLQLYHAQNEKSMAIQMVDRDNIDTTELDDQIILLIKTLFQKLLKFRSISRKSRLAAVSFLQSRIAACTPKSGPLVSRESHSSLLNFTKRQQDNDGEMAGTPKKESLKRIVTRMASSLSLSKSKSKSKVFDDHSETVASPVSSPNPNPNPLKSKKSFFNVQSISTRKSMTPNSSKPIITSNDEDEKVGDSAHEVTELQNVQMKVSDLMRENEQLKYLLSLQNNSFHETNIINSPLNMYSSESFIDPRLVNQWDDSKSAWQQDSWRLDHLSKYKRDLAFLESIMNEDIPLINHTRLRDLLVARIAALELTNPLAFSRLGFSINSLTSAPTIKEDVEDDEFDLDMGDKIHEVNRDFDPKEHDEIKLCVGDQVTVTMTFINGVAHGTNLSSGESGIFPLSSISLSINTLHPPIFSSRSPTRANSMEGGLERVTINDTISTRSSFISETGKKTPLGPFFDDFSKKSPQKALSIISELPAEQRVHYLERLGALTPPLSTSTPTSPTRGLDSDLKMVADDGFIQNSAGDVNSKMMAQERSSWNRSMSM